MKRIFFTLLIFMTILHIGCILNSGNERYTVSGCINTQDGEPLEGITVCLGETTAITNSNGFYKFTDVEYNNYLISADPYNITTYRFEPTGYKIAITKNTKINFTAYTKE